VNPAASVPGHASQMYAKNLANFLTLLVKDGGFVLNEADDIVRETLVARGGELTNPRVREALAGNSSGQK
jgi:NAD(P) transhydrogenase subunit alpha